MANATFLSECYVFGQMVHFSLVEITIFAAGQFFTSWSCDQKTVSKQKNIISVTENCNIRPKMKHSPWFFMDELKPLFKLKRSSRIPSVLLRGELHSVPLTTPGNGAKEIVHCVGVSRIHRSLSRPRPILKAVINIHEPLI